MIRIKYGDDGKVAEFDDLGKAAVFFTEARVRGFEPVVIEGAEEFNSLLPVLPEGGVR